jgi:hypothetical protein
LLPCGQLRSPSRTHTVPALVEKSTCGFWTCGCWMGKSFNSG